MGNGTETAFIKRLLGLVAVLVHLIVLFPPGAVPLNSQRGGGGGRAFSHPIRDGVNESSYF
jgi:hypothetical protein